MERLDGERQEIVDWLKSFLGARLVAVILYGSRARREDRPDSDYDVLVIARDLPDDLVERSRFFQPYRARLGLRVDLIAKSPQLFESYLPAVYLDIALDGVVLYDPSGYAQEKLTRLREIIDEAGLYRKAVPGAGFIWKWLDPPPPGKWAVEWDTGLVRDITRRAG